MAEGSWVGAGWLRLRGELGWSWLVTAHVATVFALEVPLSLVSFGAAVLEQTLWSEEPCSAERGFCPNWEQLRCKKPG